MKLCFDSFKTDTPLLFPPYMPNLRTGTSHPADRSQDPEPGTGEGVAIRKPK